jgi:hypothetical protein
MVVQHAALQQLSPLWIKARGETLTAMIPNMTANRPLTIAWGIDANSPPNFPAVTGKQALSRQVRS